ncbi:hypothetical protein HDV05_001569, partial [Chytridiales sp. JEL 0842]
MPMAYVPNVMLESALGYMNGDKEKSLKALEGCLKKGKVAPMYRATVVAILALFAEGGGEAALENLKMAVSLFDAMDARAWLNDGPRVITAYKHPASVPAIGKVANQLKHVHPNILQLTDLKEPLHNPTPTVAPTMHCVVETGSAKKEAVITESAAPSSIENPREGE